MEIKPVVDLQAEIESDKAVQREKDGALQLKRYQKQITQVASTIERDKLAGSVVFHVLRQDVVDELKRKGYKIARHTAEFNDEFDEDSITISWDK